MCGQTISLYLTKSLLDDQKHLPQRDTILNLLQFLNSRIVRLGLPRQHIPFSQLQMFKTIHITKTFIQKGDIRVKTLALLCIALVVQLLQVGAFIQADNLFDGVLGYLYARLRGK